MYCSRSACKREISTYALAAANTTSQNLTATVIYGARNKVDDVSINTATNPAATVGKSLIILNKRFPISACAKKRDLKGSVCCCAAYFISKNRLMIVRGKYIKNPISVKIGARGATNDSR